MISRSDLSRLADALNGLPILGCLDGSPAAQVGIRYGDILLAVNDRPTKTWSDFIEARSASPGEFRARVFRGGEELELELTVTPGQRGSHSPLSLLGEVLERAGLAAPASLLPPLHAAGDPSAPS